MCGIFGQFAPGGRLADAGALERATEVLQHRGPDDTGCWIDPVIVLGHRRLSIIDLGSGSQPMASHDERFVIAYNGEIYNYVEVRDELIRRGAVFATHSDTEVIIEAYRAWGTDALERLSGMFAFALYDRRNQTLLLARDRFGEKPLLYVEDGQGGITFASELKALVAAGAVDPEIDPEALELYLSLNYVPGTRTLLKEVKRLAPGHWRLYNVGHGVECGRYWTPPDPSAEPLPYTTVSGALPELRHRLDDAVRLALRSDVPVTLFLSGGIDSSLVAESAVRQGVIGSAYCLDFEEDGFSEWSQAKIVAHRLSLDLRRAVISIPDPSVFQKIIYHADDPNADSSAVAIWYLARRASEDFKVVITGDGGDELFGGYLTYKATKLYTAIHRAVPRRLLRTLGWTSRLIRPEPGKVSSSYKLQRFVRSFGLDPSLAHLTWNGVWLPNDALRLMAPEMRAAISSGGLERLVAQHGVPARPSLRHLQRLDALEYLPNDILVKVDRVTMAHGLEARAPLLAAEVAEFGLSLRDELKLRAVGKPKRILRALADETFGPAVSRAKKQGFSIPVHKWLRGPMRDTLEAFLGRAALQRLPFLDARAVAAARDRHLSGRAQLGFELWGLMALSAWWNSVTDSSRRSAGSAPPRPLVLRELAY